MSGEGGEERAPAVAGMAPGTAPLVVRFYLSMLGIVVIDFCFALIYGVPLERFAPAAALLVAITLAGAHAIFRPVLRYLRDPHRVPVPVRNIARLGEWCTAFAAAAMSALALAKFLLLPALLGFDISAVLTPLQRLWLPVVHTLYYTALIYFIMADYAAGLRARVFDWYGALVPAHSGHLLLRLLIAVGVTSLLPISLIVLHALEHDLQSERYILVQDLAAAALAIAVTLFFVTRSLLGPIHTLESATARIARNDLSASVPVVSNDETGRLASRFNRMVEGLRERALIRETFGRYLPERVAAAIVSNAGDLQPRSATATILYADVEDFTRVAEQATPGRVVKMLNEYFSAIVAPIESNHGVVTQFQGDALLATFNLPTRDRQHALSAVRAALDILRICQTRRFAGTALRARIGIATGRVTAGNVGSDTRLSYTVHGDAVNVAARLEELNKRFGTYLLLDAETARRVGDAVPVQFVDEVEIRGREARLGVFTAPGAAPQPGCADRPDSVAVVVPFGSGAS